MQSKGFFCPLVTARATQRGKGCILITSIVVFVICMISFDSMAAEKKFKSEQKILFNSNQVFYGTSTGSKECQRLCSAHVHAIKQYMNEGWRVVGSSSKEVVVEEFKEGIVPSYRWGGSGENVEPARPYSYGCKCIGTEYIIEK